MERTKDALIFSCYGNLMYMFIYSYTQELNSNGIFETNEVEIEFSNVVGASM